MDTLKSLGFGGREPVTETSATKQRRVRTGCLTCRKRHLKCDEALPSCSNCRKSNRNCQRGIRLNFIDTTIQTLPIVPKSAHWRVTFHDESRDIASEYRGGLAHYEVENTAIGNTTQLSQSGTTCSHVNPQTLFSSIEGLLSDDHADNNDSRPSDEVQGVLYPSPRSRGQSIYSSTPITSQIEPLRSISDNTFSTASRPRQYLDSQEEVLLMQVFVEEVGLWMDSLDSQKHFSQLLPSRAFSQPMLLNAFLACGARHLTLVNPNYSEDRALHYYDTATRSLLDALQDPNRDMKACATTAVILNVYEMMCESALQRMNHIAGARALIKDCGWNAQSKGVGAACFWLNIGMELLSNLHLNLQLAWDPDDWCLNMDFAKFIEDDHEEIWTYRMVYIIAKIANLRATVIRHEEFSAQDNIEWMSSKYMEWERLNDWCDSWNNSIPRTMQPLGYLHPHQTSFKSNFPEVWIIKRVAVVARLFYHTAKCLLAQIKPLVSNTNIEMDKSKETHARQICGIVAHVKDRGVASVSLRSLAIASECLTVRAEQEEVLQIFNKIQQETGWRVGFVHKELKEKWGWTGEQTYQSKAISHENSEPASSRQLHEAQQQDEQQKLAAAVMQHTSQGLMHQSEDQQSVPNLEMNLSSCQKAQVPPQNRPSTTLCRLNHRRIAGILNPTLATADFSMSQRPLQPHYVDPNIPNSGSQLPY